MLDLKIVMDLGWIVTCAAESQSAPQISLASEDGSGTRVPNLTIEVDNLDEIYERMRKDGYKIEYGPAVNPGACDDSLCVILSAVL